MREPTNGISRVWWVITTSVLIILGLLGVAYGAQQEANARFEIKIDHHDELFRQYADINASLKEH